VNNWKYALLGDITTKVGSGATPRGGKAAYKSTGIPLIRSMNVHFSGFHTEGLAFIDDEQAAALSAVEVKADDVLLNITGASIGRVTVAPANMEGARVNQHVCIIRPTEDLDPSFLRWFLTSPDQQDFIMNVQSGATRQALTKQKILEFKVPLPPIPVQRSIVAEIEKQFSRLDEAVANLKRVKANLKRYKAAVLKAAVEGKLTEEWRMAHPDVEPASKLLDRILAERRAKWEETELAKMEAKGRAPKNDKWKEKYEEPAGPEVSDLPATPDTWTWATMPQLGELNRGKSKHRPRNDPILYGGDYPLVQTGDIRHATGVLTSWRQSYSEEGLKQSRLWTEGTLCITIAANIADTAILGFDACFPDSVVGFLAENEQIETRFLEYFLRTAKENLERFAPATAQKNINLAILEQVAVVLPPIQEQKQIVEEIEKRLSITESLDQTLDASQKRACRLRQSVLMKAFSGQLPGYS